MATTWLKRLKINKGKSIASTLAKRTDYAMDAAKTTDKTSSIDTDASRENMETITLESTGYAVNPDKTDGGILVRGYECDPRTVNEEFLLAKKEYEYLTGRNNGDKNVLGYLIRQSFKPGEIEPQKALEVGYELAHRWTKGKHAFIVAVHTDKAHIHCHIVYNSTTLDCRGKFKNFFLSSFALQRLSDLICLEHGLSVIENPKPSKGKHYDKWAKDREPSWQDKLRQKIDELIPACDTFEGFISALKDDGYVVNTDRKHISVIAPGQKRASRLNTLKGEHTEDMIRERIARAKVLGVSGSGGLVRQSESPSVKVNLLINIQAKIQEGKGAGYEHWARIFNIKETAKTLLYLKEKGIDSYDDLAAQATVASAEFSAINKKIKATEGRLKEISDLQKQIGTYGKTRDVYAQYRKSGWSADFYEKHRADITLHRAAKKHFDDLGIKKLPSISSLKQEYATLASEKKKLYSGYHQAKKTMQELLVAKGNAERILGITPQTGDGGITPTTQQAQGGISRTESRSEARNL